MSLKDGTYWKSDIHSGDPDFRTVAAALMPHCPLNDDRYKGVIVKNGRVAQVIFEASPAAPAKPVQAGPTLVAPPVEDEQDEQDDAEQDEFSNLDYRQLKALAKSKGVKADGTRAEIVAKLQAAA